MTVGLTILAAFTVPYLWMMLAILLHEIAHLLVSRAVGFSPYEMRVGKGSLLFRRTIFGIDVHVRAWPGGGLARAKRPPSTGLWWRGSIFALAGPAMDCGLLVLLGISIDRLLKGNSYSVEVVILAVGLLLIQISLSFGSLFPRDYKFEQKVLPNDAKLFWSYVTGKTSQAYDAARENYRVSIARYERSFEFEESWLRKADQTSLALLTEASADLAQNRRESSVRKYLGLIESQEMTAGERAMILDSMASIPVISGDMNFMERALGWAREAHDLCPAAPTLTGTLGSLLIEDGKYAEGIEILTPLTLPENEEIDRSISACYLAKAWDRLGNPQEAARWIKTARAIGGAHAIRDRISAQLSPASRAF